MRASLKYLPALACVLLVILVASASPSQEWQARVSKDLLNIYAASKTAQAQGIQSQGVAPKSTIQQNTRARFDAKGRVQLDVKFDCNTTAPINALKAAGLVIGTTVKVPPMCVVEGWAAIATLQSIASVASVIKIELPKYSIPHPPIPRRSQEVTTKGTAIAFATNGAPAIDGNGITIMNVDKYIQQTSVKGGGITIGVISDDVTSLAVIQGRGELPVSVNVVQPSANPTPHSNLTDEGTMMLEEVYAVAPSANLAFCGPATAAEYVACLTNLIAVGATVLSDDLGYKGFDLMAAPAENEDGQVVENLLTANPNVMLFTAVGNIALNFWQGTYTPITIDGGSFTCQGQTDNYFQQFTSTSAANIWTLGGSSATPLALAWVNASGVSTANYDLYLLDGSANVIACAAGSGSTEIAGSTTYDFIDSSSLSSPNTYYILIGTPDTSLSGNFLKLIGFGDGADNWSSITSGAPSSPQDFAFGVIMVGAVNGVDGVGNTIEPYSNTGPIQLEVPSPSTLQAPLVVAPDAIYVDNSGTDFSASGGIFSGTSAASPNTAAVAVLLRSAFPTLTPAQVTNALQSGAAPLGISIPNGTFGYGRVDAIGALGALPAPTISGFQTVTIVGGSSSSATFTVSGTGPLTITVTPANLIPATAAGVVLSPSTCGNPTTACTVTLTPTIGQSGSTTVQLTVTDGAKRSMSYQAGITVTKPPAPTISITSGGTQSVNVSTAIAPIVFTLTGTGPLTFTPTLNGIGTMTITPGCGTSTMNCTATLGTASATAGTATLTLAVHDAYAQTGSASATVTENALPASSGGGTIDLSSLLAMGALVALIKRRSTR